MGHAPKHVGVVIDKQGSTSNPFGSRTGGLGGSLRALEEQVNKTSLPPGEKMLLGQGVQEAKDQLRLYERAYEKDTWFYRVVVGTLGLTVLLVVGAITALIFGGKSGYDALTAIGSAAVGALVGLLAPSPAGSRQS